MKAAVAYHFFPHYRTAVLRELLNSPVHEYLLVADDKPWDSSIRPYQIQDPSRFVRTPCRGLLRPFLFQRGLLGLACRRDLDAIIFLANPYFISTWMAAAIARVTGKRILFWTHGWTHEDRGLKGWFRRTFYKLSHGLLLYGHAAKSSGLAHGFAPEQMHVIYNSLDYEAQKAARTRVTDEAVHRIRQELFPEPAHPIVICSARLTSSCRFDLLLEAQRLLRDQGHFVNVLLVGEGPERSRLESMAREHHLPVRLHGACYDEHTLALLHLASHVTVSPGKVGLTAVHSLAYGTPVITHDAFAEQGPEWEAILPGLTGDFFRQNDVMDLAEKIRRWTSGPRLSPQVREQCHEILERFYNPGFQRRAIDRAVSGAAADDLFWMKEAA